MKEMAGLRNRIEFGVNTLIHSNMGIKKGENLLIMTDIPTPDEWKKQSYSKLEEMTERNFLAKLIYEIATENLKDCEVSFLAYPSVGQHGRDPGESAQRAMEKADAVLAPSNYSLTHTESRKNACKKGTRIASMPGIKKEMFFEDGPMAADYLKIREESKDLSTVMDSASQVWIRSPGGTDMKFSIKDRKSIVDDGILFLKGVCGNMPAGELFIAPVEETANGRLVVEKGWLKSLDEDMTFIFHNGFVRDVIGGGDTGEQYRELFCFNTNDAPYIYRRNCAEFGIGMNPNATNPDETLEAEKIKGTIHIAVGDNFNMGGKIKADLHQDFVIPKPTVQLDKQTIIKDGKCII